jgi:hypothetical protein
MVKEAFIVGQNYKSMNMKGYDESNELAIAVMQFKASLAKLLKIKKLVNIRIGDEDSLENVQREIMFTSRLTTKMKE